MIVLEFAAAGIVLSACAAFLVLVLAAVCHAIVVTRD